MQPRHKNSIPTSQLFPEQHTTPWSAVLGVLPALHGLQVARTITRIEDIACFIVYGKDVGVWAASRQIAARYLRRAHYEEYR